MVGTYNPLPGLQTKENLTLRASSFGSKCEMSVPYLDKIIKCGLADSILSFAEFKSQKELKKNDGTKRSRLLGKFGQSMATASPGMCLPISQPFHAGIAVANANAGI